MTETKTTKTDILKSAMLEALEKSFGRVSDAVNSLKGTGAEIHRSTHYDWLRDDEEYAKSVRELKGVALDHVESKLFEKINGIQIAKINAEGEQVVYDVPPSDTAIIFFLKTQGKERGYIEKTEQSITVDKPLIIDWSGAYNPDSNNPNS